MRKDLRELLDSPEHLTLKEAANEVGIDPVTFKKYANRIGIVGTPVSKYTFYEKKDVEKVKKIMVDQVPIWLRMLENATGKRWAPVND